MMSGLGVRGLLDRLDAALVLREEDRLVSEFTAVSLPSLGF